MSATEVSAREFGLVVFRREEGKDVIDTIAINTHDINVPSLLKGDMVLRNWDSFPEHITIQLLLIVAHDGIISPSILLEVDDLSDVIMCRGIVSWEDSQITHGIFDVVFSYLLTATRINLDLDIQQLADGRVMELNPSIQSTVKGGYIDRPSIEHLH